MAHDSNSCGGRNGAFSVYVAGATVATEFDFPLDDEAVAHGLDMGDGTDVRRMTADRTALDENAPLFSRS